MRTMYDGIIPGSVPAGAQLYAAYLDGNWADFAALVAQHPNAVGVPISVSASYNGGKVLDVETGDATAAQSVGWVVLRRAAGVDPTVYCNTSTWPAVRTEFQARGVKEPHYWLAQYDGVATIPANWVSAGVVAKQYADRGGYDISVVADYWPGIDPAPTTQGVVDMTPEQAALLQQIYNAVFFGGTSMGPVPPGQPNDSLICQLAYVTGELVAANAGLTAVEGEVKTFEPAMVDPVALGAALAANAAFVNGVAAAVVAKIGTDITTAPKA